MILFGDGEWAVHSQVLTSLWRQEGDKKRRGTRNEVQVNFYKVFWKTLQQKLDIKQQLHTGFRNPNGVWSFLHISQI